MGDEVRCQDEDTAVVFKFAEEGWGRGKGLVFGAEGEEEEDSNLRSKSVGSFA